MSVFTLLLIGLFLPLFPFSIVFNHLLERLRHPLLRVGLLLLWPQLGVALFLWAGDEAVPSWVLAWAALTALLYAFRLLTQRDVNGWVGFLATSAWSLLWFALPGAGQHAALVMDALGFSIPLALLALLAVALEQRFGAAYTHLYGGLAGIMPRFAGLLVFSTLAATATPIFPAFFIMLKTLTLSSPLSAVVVLLTWLIWSWAGVRLLQGLLVGAAPQNQQVSDLPRGLSWAFALTLTVLVVAGLFLTGDIA
ncbi:hypothetical protein J9253_17510 [Thiothrix litoralis]|uniref:NADH:quinone oxidoreductase/Mrp antiporter membrane subunit domain-containing protein n=1 Tax=Thiothrix litoralis TaxID=2891210 RepID=A0ABX7WRJ6_9GAMM|nr:hypothetical protein [Thiothrix litoralis]QTR45766.1 hypothetical protein J9253_17510 [Thiothrix litoralis]